MPSIVRDVEVTNLLSGRRMLIEWTLNSSAESVTAYEIWRSTTEYQGFSKVAEVPAPMYQYVDKIPYTFGIVFFYKVLARNASGILSDMSQSNAVQDSTFDDFEERPFRATMVTFDNFITGEVPVGLTDGANFVFNTSNLFRFNSVQIYVNGIAQVRDNDFAEGTDQRTITLTTPPNAGAHITASYLKV